VFEFKPETLQKPDSIEQAPCKHRASTTQVEKVLRFCFKPRKRDAIQQYLKLKHREHFRKTILKPLVETGALEMTLPDKPNSPKQEYVVTSKGERIVVTKK